MGLADDLKKKIEKRQEQLKDLESRRHEIEMQIRESNAALQAFQEILKITTKDESDDKTEPRIRAGSMVAQARDALRKHGKPMHVVKLLEAMGKITDHDTRVSLSGSLSAYFRAKQIFTRPEANVFGLLEWNATDEEVGNVVEMLEASAK